MKFPPGEVTSFTFRWLNPSAMKHNTKSIEITFITFEICKSVTTWENTTENGKPGWGTAHCMYLFAGQSGCSEGLIDTLDSTVLWRVFHNEEGLLLCNKRFRPVCLWLSYACESDAVVWRECLSRDANPVITLPIKKRLWMLYWQKDSPLYRKWWDLR